MNRKILIVEDESAILMAMKIYLQKSGFQIATATSGADGLQNALADPPDLIMLDLLLPQMNGFLVLEALKENATTADIPVVVCSAKAQESDKKRVMELGARAFLSKPFTPSQLLAAVEENINMCEERVE